MKTKTIIALTSVAFATMSFADVASAPVIQPVSASVSAVAQAPAVQPAPTVASAPSGTSAEEYEPGALCHLYAVAPEGGAFRYFQEADFAKVLEGIERRTAVYTLYDTYRSFDMKIHANAAKVRYDAVMWTGVFMAKKSGLYTFIVQTKLPGPNQTAKFPYGVALAVNGTPIVTCGGQQTLNAELKAGYNSISVLFLPYLDDSSLVIGYKPHNTPGNYRMLSPADIFHKAADTDW